MGSGDGVAREAAWLATSGDGLPALLASAGGPFDVVQAYMRWPYATEQRTIYVRRTRLQRPRFAAQRLQSVHAFRLTAWWPILDGEGSTENEQQALDNAIELVLQRIDGFVHDKTHGGRFLQAAEEPRDVQVEFIDAEQTLPEGYLRAEVLYGAADSEIPG